MEKLYILDAVNYLFRSYYAIGSMTNHQGESTSALYGFIRSVQKIIKDFAPVHFIAVFDGPDNKLSRQAVYAEYKMNRKKAPEDLFPQFEWAFEYCRLAGIPCISVPNVEADDTIASITSWASSKGSEVYICSSDKDLCQLVSDKVFLLHAHKNNQLIDAKKVEEIYGVKPHQMLDFLAIMGDSSDNIPGISGFGPKTAAKLLQEFHSLDYILENPSIIAGKKKQQTLIQEKDKALLSRDLARLDYSIAFEKTNDFFLIKKPDEDGLRDLYQEMNFITLLKDLGPAEEAFQNKEVKPETVLYTLIDDEAGLNKLLNYLNHQKCICVDTETTDVHPLQAQLVGIGFCAKMGTAYYVPCNALLGKEKVLQSLKSIFENPEIGFFGHNLKYDYHVLKEHGITIQNIIFDTILASYLLNPQNRRHNLDDLSLSELQKHKISIKQLIGEGKKQISMNQVPIEQVKEYCAEDVDYTFRLKTIFEKKLKEKKLEKLLQTLEMPLLTVLAKMERKGIFLNTKKLKKMGEEILLQIKKLELSIYEKVGESFNLNSPKQLSEILYTRLGLTPPSRKKTEYSTGAKVLETLAKENAIVSKILEYRALEKLRSTYIEALPSQILKKTGRIHCTFNQSIVATGRLSSQNPNLQNIPVRTKEGKKIRASFQPQKDGWSYLSADYSQIELRLLAHFSEDPSLIEAFHQDVDIHQHTASLVFNVPINKVTPSMRGSAKTVNFGILYGQGPFGLSQELKISMREASDFIKTYFERYPKVAEYLKKSKEDAKKQKIVYTLMGRSRPLPEMINKNPIVRSAAVRLAINAPLQGSSADLIKLAMIEIDQKIERLNLQGFMILQIHDELVFEIPDFEIEIFKKIVRESMENIYPLKVPLIVNIAVGKNWEEC